MRPHDINSQKNFISGWYIDSTLCDEIVKLCMGRNRLNLDGYQKNTHRGYLSSILSDLSVELYLKYQNEFNKVLSLYKEEYSFLNTLKFDIELIGEYKHIQVQVYDPKYFYNRLHCENDGLIQSQHKRCLVFMTYLNDVTDGGQTHFPSQNVMIKPEKGLTLIWPAYWTHPHTGVVSNTETKVITTGWLEFNSKAI